MLPLPPILPQMLPTPLYAETHFRPRWMPSLIWRPEPEIIADAPHRLEPGAAIPIFLLLHDAHRFPCTIHHVAVTIRSEHLRPVTVDLVLEPIEVRDRWWWKLFTIDRPAQSGWIECDVEIEVESAAGRTIHHNDNLRTSSRKPLRIFLAEEPLPRLPGLQLGEGHSHSNYTDDQVEFGSPLAPAGALAAAMGLSFYCVTDHSYDLDDAEDDYLRNDPTHPKWQRLQREVDAINAHDPACTVVRGEEVSCRTRFGHTVHFLLYGNTRFIPGSGDSGERLFHTWCEHSIAEIARQLEPGVAAFASHAMEPVPFLQRLILDRTAWDAVELATPGLHGLQFANGKRDAGFQAGRRAWVEALLAGRRLLTIGGNDAHGNFNRFRQLRLPFLLSAESDEQIFGGVRTGVFIGERTERAIVDAFASGASIVTDGPVANMRIAGASGLTSIGSSFTGASCTILVEALSTPEFGPIRHCRVYHGHIGEPEELVIHDLADAGLRTAFELTVPVSRPGYVRIEAQTHNGSRDLLEHFCYTNPIWLSPATSGHDSTQAL